MSCCWGAGMAALGKQPTPFCVLALLFGFLHCSTIGFAASSNICTRKFVDSRRHNLAGPSPPARQGCGDWQAYPLYDWRIRPSELAACKALENASCSPGLCVQQTIAFVLFATRCSPLRYRAGPLCRLLHYHCIATTAGCAYGCSTAPPPHQQPWQGQRCASSSCRAGPSSACCASRRP